jgi:hypothetical protein
MGANGFMEWPGNSRENCKENFVKI